MTQAELNQEIADATGESVFRVNRMGFVLLTAGPFEQERNPLVVDWDEVEQTRAVLYPV